MTANGPTGEIKVRNLSHRYGDLHVIDNLSFDVEHNEFLCLAGPSGCGKTTLSELLCGIKGLQAPSQVLLDGTPVSPKTHNIAFVFQAPSALPWKNVWDNVAFGLKIQGIDKATIGKRVREVIQVVGLAGYESYYPYQISGGMQQRVAIARAVAADAEFIMMDEPFVSLDQPTRERMQIETLRVWEQMKRTVVFVTHNLEEAVIMADRILVLSAKPARIKADVRVEIPRPRDPLSAEFIALRARLKDILMEEVSVRPT